MKTIIISLKLFFLFTLLLGLAYPLLITGVAQIAFPEKANGSLILRDNKIIGSELIGQQFDSATYFWPRPSAINYNPIPSGGSNYALTNSKLREIVYHRKQQFITSNFLDSTVIIPSEMLFASASGLDPHISKKAALLQVNRIAKARKFNSIQQQKLLECVEKFTEAPQYLVLGIERVNVLLLNLEIDKIK